jgi:hypothetical protein
LSILCGLDLSAACLPEGSQHVLKVRGIGNRDIMRREQKLQVWRKVN